YQFVFVSHLLQYQSNHVHQSVVYLERFDMLLDYLDNSNFFDQKWYLSLFPCLMPLQPSLRSLLLVHLILVMYQGSPNQQDYIRVWLITKSDWAWAEYFRISF